MKGERVDTAWRTVQLFISSNAAGVFEVDIHTETRELRCSCPVFAKRLRRSCKHTSFVKSRMILNGGHYSIQIPHEVSDEMAALANDSQKNFRDFILKYAKIEVL